MSISSGTSTPGAATRVRTARRTSVVLFLLALVTVLAPVRRASGQYTGTYFVPGLNETSNVWTHDQTPAQLAGRIQLGDVQLPNLTSYREIDFQAQELASHVRGRTPGSMYYFVGHSMGGVTSRNLLISPNPAINTAGSIAGIVTVASPNRGAPVAAKASEYDPRTTVGLIEGFLHTIKLMVLNPLLGAVDALLSWFLRWFLDEQLFAKLANTARGLQLPGAMDLRPSSPNMQRIGGTADGAPHAAVWGTVPQQYSWARLAASQEFESPEDKVQNLKKGRTALRVCKAILYNIIIKTGTGKACHTGDRAIGGFDEKWKEWTHFSNAPNTATDGLLPEESLRYPLEGNTTKQLRASGNQDHFSIVWRDPGVIRIGDGMLAAGMRPADSPPPPPSDPDDPPPSGCANPTQIICDP